MKEDYLRKRDIAVRRYLNIVKTYPHLGSLQSKGRSRIMLEIAQSKYTLNKIARRAYSYYRKNYGLSKHFQAKVGKPKHKPEIRRRFDPDHQYSKKELVEIINRYTAFAKTKKQRQYMDAFIDNYIDVRMLIMNCLYQ